MEAGRCISADDDVDADNRAGPSTRASPALGLKSLVSEELGAELNRKWEVDLC